MLLSVKSLCDKFQIAVTGILHIGAHLAEEAGEYEQLTKGPIVWVEGNLQPQIVGLARAPQRGQHHYYEYWIGDPSKQPKDHTQVYVASNGQSSSLKLPLLHCKYYPTISFQQARSTVPVLTLDGFMQQRMDPRLYEDINLLCMDIQGGEGDVLLHAAQTLPQLKAIYMEVNTKMLYAGLSTLGDIDHFLQHRGFLRMDTTMLAQGWGDAIYVRV